MNRLRISALLAIALTGCFSPAFESGTLLCSMESSECPPGFNCISGHCWAEGEQPDGFVPGDEAGVPDLSDSDSLEPQPAGQPCASDANCVTGFCADTVCCDTRCDGLCVSCNLAGSVGSCAPIARGASSPITHPGCTAEDKSTCMHDGTCDGAGGCALWPQSTVCKPSSCNSGNQKVTATSTCDGKGVCVTPIAIPCAPYLCQDAVQCWPACNTANMATQCAPPNTCVSSSCGKKGPGAVCGGDGECQSNHCADSYCCDSACTGTCEACNLPATLGTCTPVTGNAAHGTCPGSGTCGSACNGTNRTTCIYKGTGTVCNDGNPCTYNDVCNGSGGCGGTGVSCPANTACSLYSCNGTSSCAVTNLGGATSCNDGNPCTYGDVCNGAGGCGGTTVTCPANQACITYSCNGTSVCTTTFRTGTCGTCTCGDYVCDGAGNCKPQGCHSLPCP